MPTNDSLLKLFGETLLWHPQTNSCASPEEVLGDRTVLLYFSASWCMPCVRFTPKLIELYTNLKQRGQLFELVLCSMDQDYNCFSSYATKMPWYAIPFDHPEITQLLVNRFEANGGIPHLAIISQDGSMLEVDDAIAQVKADPVGQHFPWPPKPLSSLLPDHYCRYSDGVMEQIPSSALENKYLLLYFAARWSATCQESGPKLEKIYANLKKYRNDFEVLLVSADRYNDEFCEHLSGLSFCAIPYKSEACRIGLTQRLRVKGGPAIVMLGRDHDEVINDNVCPMLQGDYISSFPYYPRNYGDLTTSPMDINQHKCILVFCEGADDALQEDVVEACQLAATSMKTMTNESFKVLWNLKPNGVGNWVRQATQLPPLVSDTALLQMVLLDLPGNSAYYVSTKQDEHLTSQDIVTFCQNPGVRRSLL